MNFEGASLHNLTTILSDASSQEDEKRRAAESSINYLQQKDLASWLQALAAELNNPNVPPGVRQLAGILLKNALGGRDEHQQHLILQRWAVIPNEVRSSIRQTVFLILASPLKEARLTAAMVISKLAALDIPRGEWMDLIQALLNSVRDSKDDNLKESAFICLGYICEEIPRHVQGHANQILDAISQGMKADETNDEVKLAATQTLLNCLEFVKTNFENAAHRNMILMMVFAAANSKNLKVRITAFQCLCQIGELYYDKIGQYMGEIFKRTHQAIQAEETPVQLLAVEFWSTVAEVENDILEENIEAQELGRPPTRSSQNCVNKALEHIVPLLLQALTTQQEYDMEEWDIAKAAGCCLGLLSQCARDNIVGHVLPFVQEKINSDDWHQREAATLAFGSILDGPTKEKLAPLVAQAFPLILKHVSDKHVAVKDTAAWTVGRICELLPQSIDPRILPNLMGTLLGGLKDSPKVAANICWAIHNLAEAVRIPPGKDTSPISKYFEELIGGLLAVGVRDDATEANLMPAAYEAINVLIMSAAPDVYDSIEKLIATLVERLQKTMSVHGLAGKEQEHQNQVQGLLGGALTTIIQKLDKSKIIPKADGLMNLFLTVLNSKNATVHEEILMAIGSLAGCCGGEFEKYMDAIKPTLIFALKNYNEYQVCQVAVGVVGDICRALERKILPYCDNIVALLLQNLQNPNMERSVKPHIISCLGDMALAIGGNFERYHTFVMMMFVQASQTKFDFLDYDNIDYLNQLRESILEAYTGIIQGLESDKKGHLFEQFVAPTIALVGLVVKDENRDTGVVNAACGVVGDLVNCLGSTVKEQVRVGVVQQLLAVASSMNDEKVTKNAQWASQALSTLA